MKILINAHFFFEKKKYVNYIMRIFILLFSFFAYSLPSKKLFFDGVKIESSKILSYAKKTNYQSIITGIVSDENGLPLSGVSVIIQDTQVGTYTDFDGTYSLNVDVKNASKVLVFSYIGKKNEFVQITDNYNINVKMKTDVQGLDETVIVSYGTSKRRSLVGSVVTIKKEDISERPLTNFTNALEGTVVGLQTTPGSGLSGSTPEIVIRGIGTNRLGSSSPLYVIDGFPFDLQTTLEGGDNAINPLSSINPNDIENISVLKGASATSLYGSRAANGVVLITTKKGVKTDGKPVFNLSVQQGFITNAVPLNKTLDRKQYYELFWRGLKNQQLSRGDSDQVAAQSASNNLINRLGYNIYNVPNDQLVGVDGNFNPNAQLLLSEEDLNWQSAANSPGIRTNYGFDVSNASKKSNYFVSGNYLKEESNQINSRFERFNTRINTNTDATKWLKLGISLAGTHTINRGSGSNALTFSRTVAPIYPIYLHNNNGDRILDSNGEPIFDTGAEEIDFNGNVIFPEAFGLRSLTRPLSPRNNPLLDSQLNVNSNATTLLSGRTFFDITFFKGLTFKTGLSIDLLNSKSRNFTSALLPRARRAQRDFSDQRVITLNQILTYDKRIGSHHFNALLGHESFESVQENASVFKENQILNGNLELTNFNIINEDLSIQSSYIDSAIESYFSRVNYDFENKYFMSLSFRRDATSILSKDNRFGNFYSAGLGWDLSSASFIKKINWINFLKLRASTGTSGNTLGFSAYTSQSTFNGIADNGPNVGFIPSGIGGDNLKWESQRLEDIALEFSLFGDRLGGTIEYYKKTSDDLIFQVPQPLSLGLPRTGFETLVLLNIGEIENSGFEIQLQSDIVKTEDFRWNINANLSTTKTVTTRLPDRNVRTNDNRLLTEGGDLFEWYLPEFAGVDPSNGNALYRGLKTPNQYDETTDIIVANDTLTSNFSSAAEYRTGKNSTPDAFGGITNKISYKNFSITALLTYQIGGYTYNRAYNQLLNPRFGETAHVDILNAWQKPGDITDIPRHDPFNRQNQFSDRWLVSRTNMVLRRVTLDFNFPKSAIEKAGMSAANIYVSGENLAFFSSQRGLNTSNIREGLGAFNPGRLISLGLNLKF